MPIMQFRLGDCFRLDRIYGRYMNEGMPNARLHADYGATVPPPALGRGEYYPLRDNQIYNGFVVVAWICRTQGQTWVVSVVFPAAIKVILSYRNR